MKEEEMDPVGELLESVDTATIPKDGDETGETSGVQSQGQDHKSKPDLVFLSYAKVDVGNFGPRVKASAIAVSKTYFACG